MDAKAKVVPYEVGGWYRQKDGQWAQLVGVENVGNSYECMYSLDTDGQRIHRYTNRPGDYGRVTGTAHDYSDPRNIPPTIPLTDHEAALAELKDQALADVTGKLKAELAQRKAERALQTLLTGLEALAGEWDTIADVKFKRHNKQKGIVNNFTDHDKGEVYEDCAEQLRTLASAGLEGKVP